ncbi:KH domain-containing At4g18375 isoform X1 [Olea europaea subsp. europaea]|uniref:KH domain-containing At4g18375 isoform X1 n=1 Tax=Olea europaea subsp. europaea TaxID=158383 RepID=A0A8S0TU66_OLEEU|nr:KH domain-containing At4g18375 isoform X1 [Olea europaea subsp. europaea]
MGENGKRFSSHRDDGDIENQKRQLDRERDRDDKGNDELIVYRIRCPDGAIGNVIRKSGNIINSIWQETRAKVALLKVNEAITNVVGMNKRKNSGAIHASSLTTPDNGRESGFEPREVKVDPWKPLNCLMDAANRSKSSKFTSLGSAAKSEAQLSQDNE